MIQNTKNFGLALYQNNIENLIPNLTFTDLKLKSEPIINHDAYSIWRILQPNIGLKSLEITVHGYCSSEKIVKSIRIAAFNGDINQYKCIFDKNEYLEGQFIITDYKIITDPDNLQFFTMTLTSSGEVTYAFQ